jgi:transportin-3
MVGTIPKNSIEQLTQKAAWNITTQLIRMPNANTETKVFAAQTFRQKIELDIQDLDTSSLAQLRDSLIQLCHTYKDSKSICTQLCISLADLAIQMPSWENPVQYMINSFANSPETTPLLLEFLEVLPEELSYNTKINLEVNGD